MLLHRKMENEIVRTDKMGKRHGLLSSSNRPVFLIKAAGEGIAPPDRLVHANRTRCRTKEVEHPDILAKGSPPAIGLAFREFIRKPRRDEPVILRLEFKGKIHRSHAFLKQERIIDESLG